MTTSTPQPTADYGFTVGSRVCHVKDSEPGIVTELDANHDLGGVTTCRVVWGATSLVDALATPREDQDIQWTNKLVRIPDDEVPAWEYLDPPFFWKAFGGDVIADRTLPDGTRQHLVRGHVPPGTVIGNAQVFGEADGQTQR